MSTTTLTLSSSKLYVAPCIKCGSQEINLYNNKCSTLNSGGGKCSGCGNDVLLPHINRLPTPYELAAIWNNQNDKELLIMATQKNIETQKVLATEITGD